MKCGIDFAAWYGAHALVRRLWAIKDAQGLRVVVALEPTHDGDDTHPAWIAHREAWVRELQSHTERTVRLEQIENEVALDADGVIVAALHWRDPAMY